MDERTALGGSVAAIIPARGGSKSIPKKNLVNFGGQPLISYVIKAAKCCDKINRIICSTDSEEIASLCRRYGIEIAERESTLASDTAKITEVLHDLVEGYLSKQHPVPEILVLMQPTSPFVAQEHLAKCILKLREDPSLNSVQTVVRVPHNQHAFNQRFVEDNKIKFKFPEERRIGYNKQNKPTLFQFGNLVAFRTTIIRQGGEVFSEPSGFVEIERNYSFDLDGPEDIRWGEYCLQHQLVTL